MTFWHNRWKTQQIGWHRAAYNDLLTKHWDSIGAPDKGEVLVPLCGKSLDMPVSYTHLRAHETG